MANHKATKKDMRQAAKRREKNRYYGKTTRNAIRDLKALTDKTAASEKLNQPQAAEQGAELPHGTDFAAMPQALLGTGTFTGTDSSLFGRIVELGRLTY